MAWAANGQPLPDDAFESQQAEEAQKVIDLFGQSDESDDDDADFEDVVYVSSDAAGGYSSAAGGPTKRTLGEAGGRAKRTALAHVDGSRVA